MKPRVPKSLLYTPATKPEFFSKLFACGAHIGVIDLEDGVSLPMKEKARENLAEFLAIPRAPEHPLVAVRVNELSTPEGLKDLLLLGEGATQEPNILILTMVAQGAVIQTVKNYLSHIKAKTQVFVNIERPEAISELTSIARHADGLIFGSADYCASLGISIGGWEKLLFARSTIVNAAAIFDIPCYDTAVFQLANDNELIEESVRARDLGFTGKTAIHPCQIQTINSLFTPSEIEISDAELLVQTYEEAGGGIVRVKNNMVGPPMYKLAKKILSKV